MNPPPLPDAALTEKVRSGQRLLIGAILINIVSTVLRIGGQGSQELLLLSIGVALVGLVISILGMLRVSRGLRYHWGLSILFCILMLIPLVNLITLLILNGKATTALRVAGLHVGFLGAKKVASGAREEIY